MATVKQKKALDALVGNGGNVTKAMLEVGYSKNTANTPQKLTESIGFQELMNDKGLTDDLLVDALVDDIIAKPKRRFKELELGFKVRGRLNPDGNEGRNNNIMIFISGEGSNRYANPTDASAGDNSVRPTSL
jgi:hypothetical protein